MKKISYLILFTALALGKGNMAVAMPVLNIIDLESTSLARISVTTQPGVIEEWSSLKSMTEANLKKGDIETWRTNTVDVDLKDENYETSASVYAGILFWKDGFSNSEHWQDAGLDHHPLTLEATSQLDMRFTVKGEGAMIAADAHSERNGLHSFSLFDETEGTMLFESIADTFSINSGELYLTDGHTYQLYALSKIGPGGYNWGEFYWNNSPFAIQVPEGSTLLFSIPGLFLLLLIRRIRSLNFIRFPAKNLISSRTS